MSMQMCLIALLIQSSDCLIDILTQLALFKRQFDLSAAL
jgi:hypothetical protein